MKVTSQSGLSVRPWVVHARVVRRLAVGALALLALAAPVAPLSAQTSSERIAPPLETSPAADAPKKPRAVKSVAKSAAKSGGKAASAKQAKKTAAHEPAPQAPEPWAAVDPARASVPMPPGTPVEPKSVVGHMNSTESMEIGGKWNGNNDTAEKTRVDNYNSDAVGTGGEVGLKLHF